MENLLSLNEPQDVWFEPIPLNTVGFHVEAHSNVTFYKITCWTTSDQPLVGYGAETYDSFYDNHCYGCEYNNETIEINIEHQYILDTATDTEVQSTTRWIEALTPCPCHNDGIGEVSFPCVAGHDEPSEEMYEDGLSAEYLVFSIARSISYNYVTKDAVYQQKIIFDEETKQGSVSPIFPVVNTYASDNHVCWGDNDVPNSLLEMEDSFRETECNQDLTSFSAHEYGATRLKDADVQPLPGSFKLPDLDYLGDQYAIAIAHLEFNLKSFLMLGACGAHLNGPLAYIPIVYIKELKLYISEPLGEEELCLIFKPKTYDGMHFLGQEPYQFLYQKIQQCKSTQQQSSEQVELVNT